MAVALLPLAALLALPSCSDDVATTPAVVGEIGRLLVLSEPVSGSPPLAAAGAASAAELVFVSLAPGAVPEARTATIRNLASGQLLGAAVIDGGFDPVGIEADVGDELQIDLLAATVIATSKVVVPARRPPKVVRTEPAKGKKDVPLNDRIVVVFSEPVDPATVNESTVRLLTDGEAVAGSLRMGNAVTAELLPAAPLLPGAVYQLEITQSIRDLSGDALETPLSVSFTTTTQPPALSVSGLYVATFDGSDPRRLTSGHWPSWSPDAQRIAFERDGDVYLIDADGSNEIRLAQGRTPAWSPDGSRIAVEGTDGITIMNVDGSGATVLLRHDYLGPEWGPWPRVTKPAWSPDGQRIVFQWTFGDEWWIPSEVLVVSVNGSTPRRASTARTYSTETDPSWSPDGSTIVFWSFMHGIVTVDAGGSLPSATFGGSPVCDDARPSWSADGSVLTFNTCPFSGTPLVLAVPAGGGETRVLLMGAREATWSPVGADIAFVVGR